MNQIAEPLLVVKASPGIFGRGLRRCFAHLCRYGGIWLGVLSLILFFHVCGFEFLAWGDAELFTNNPPVPVGLFWSNISAAFDTPAPWDGVLGPVAMISHMADFQMFLAHPLSHHLTSVWIHVFNIILLFAVVRQFSKSVWVAALAAAIFALHPLQVAPVVWISQRRILLATLFVLAAVWSWMGVARPSRSPPAGVAPSGSLHRTTAYWYFGALGTCLLAALSYPASAVLVLLVTILYPYSWAVGSQGWPAGRRPYVRLLAQAPIWIIAVTMLVWSLSKTTPWSVGTAENSRFQLQEAVGMAAVHLVDVFSTLARSLWKMVTLGSVSPTFNLEAGNVSARDLWVALMGVAIVGCGFWSQSAGRRLGATGTGRGPQILAGLVWFLSCGVAAVFTGREDAFTPVQWTYLGNAGLALAAACALAGGLAVIGQRRLLRVFVPVVVLAMAWAGYKEMVEWSESGQTLKRMVESGPNGWQGWRVWHALAIYEGQHEKDAVAVKCFQEALAFEGDARSLYRLAHLERGQKKMKRAEMLFEELTRQKGMAALAHAALGKMAEERGDLGEADRQFAAAIAVDSRNVGALGELALIQAAAPESKMRNAPKALALAKRGLYLTKNGDLRSLTAAAAAYAELGDYQRAQTLARRALFSATHLGNTNEMTLCEDRLDNYNDEKPWRISFGQTNLIVAPTQK